MGAVTRTYRNSTYCKSAATAVGGYVLGTCTSMHLLPVRLQWIGWVHRQFRGYGVRVDARATRPGYSMQRSVFRDSGTGMACGTVT